MEDLTADDVASWLASAEVGHGDKVEQFRRQEIDGSVLLALLEMGAKDQHYFLEQVGMSIMGPKVKFINNLKKLKNSKKAAHGVPSASTGPNPSHPPTSTEPPPPTQPHPPIHTSAAAYAFNPPFEPSGRAAETPNSADRNPPQVVSDSQTPSPAPLQPNHVRVHLSAGQHFDVPTQPDNCMEVVYEAIQVEYPAALLLEYPGKRSAILRKDPLAKEVQLVPCLSLPLVLPTEIIVPKGHAGCRDPGLAQTREILEYSSFGEYVSLEDGDETVRFKHNRHAVSCSDLVVLTKMVRHLDKLINGRKVGFLSAVGKPRQGKSTLLTLIGQHFMKAKSAGAIFQVSDSFGTACTSGLWVSTVELTQCRDQDNRLEKDPDSVVLMLDAEGLFADEAGKGSDYFVQLFTIVAVLSSSMILNSKIDNTVDDSFRLFPGQLAAIFQGFYSQNPWFREHKPRVVYLARDWRKPQSLHEDHQIYRDAEERESAPGSDGEAATKFTKEAFGSVEFCTLSTPVTGEEKQDVLNKPLAPSFTNKLKEILDEVIAPDLKPKFFADRKTGSSRPITGAAPLEQLLCSLVAASGNAALDWPSAMSIFNQKAAQQALDVQARQISKELEKQFSAVDLRWIPETPLADEPADAKLLRESAKRAGVEVSTADGGGSWTRYRVEGSLRQVSDFLHALDQTRFRIQHPEPQQLFDALRQKLHGNFPTACEPLKRYGFAEDDVSAMFSEKIGMYLTPLVQLFHNLLEAIGKQVVCTWEVQVSLCEDLDDLQECEGKAVEELDTLQSKQVQHDPVPGANDTHPSASTMIARDIVSQLAIRVAVNVEGLRTRVREKALAMAQAMDNIVSQEVERVCAEKFQVPLPPGTPLASVISDVGGDELFRATVAASDPSLCGTSLKTEERASMVTGIVLSCTGHDQPRLVQCMGRKLDAVEAKVRERCVAMERVLQAEQTRRLVEQLNLALQPLGCLPEELAERVAAEFLQAWVGEQEGAQIIVRELDASDSMATHDIGFLNLLEDVKKLVEVAVIACQKSLGNAWAQRLCKVVVEACTVLKQMAKLEHQLALYADSEAQLRYLLQETLGIALVTLEQMCWEGGRYKFRVSFASEADLEKVVSKSIHIVGLEEMGFRPPSESWVSPWVEAAFENEDWRSCITDKRQDIDRIFYNAAFETTVVNKCKNNICLLRGIEVKVLLRFPVVLFPLHQGVSKETLAQCLEKDVGGEVNCDALIYIGTSNIAYATLEAASDIRAKFRVARKVEMPRGEEGSARSVQLVMGPLEGEWLWSSGPPASIRQEYKRWKDAALVQIKNEFIQEIRERKIMENTPDLKDRLLQRVQGAFPEVKDDDVVGIQEEFAEAFENQQFEQLDAEIRKIATEVCGFFSLEFNPERYRVNPAKEQDRNASKEEVIHQCLHPLIASLKEEMRGHAADLHWLQQRLPSKEVTRGMPVEELQALLLQLLHSGKRRARLELVGKILGVPEVDFADEAATTIEEYEQYEPGSREKEQALKQLVGLIYRLKGRRHVPETMLTQVCSSSSPLLRQQTNEPVQFPTLGGGTTPVADAVKASGPLPMNDADVREAVELVQHVCRVFSCVEECQVPHQVVSYLRMLLQKKQGEVIAQIELKDHVQFLLKDADKVFRQLLEDDAPVSCEVMRQLPCKLRSEVAPEMSVEKLFMSLDRWRETHGAYVTGTEQRDGKFFATFSLWHVTLPKLPLNEFECANMLLVRDSKSVSATGAFPVACTESVFFGSFTEFARLPGAYTGAQQLMPQKRRLPPAIPEAGMDLFELAARFPTVEEMEMQYVQGKRWDAEAAQQLMSRCHAHAHEQAVREPKNISHAHEQAVRVMVMMHTLGILKAGNYVLKGKEALPKQVLQPRPVRPYVEVSRQDGSKQHAYLETEVKVTALDSLSAACEAVRGGEKRVLVLNMANRDNPGGGYRKGSRAQEEDLFRRTTLSQSLDPDGEGSRAKLYPLQEFLPMISKEVTAFRGPEHEGWPLLDEPFSFDVISVAAYNANVGHGGQNEKFKVTKKQGNEFRFTEEGFAKTAFNISRLLEAAACEGCRHLILGALGCGAFANHPDEVAGIFKEMLPMFAGCFKVVEFAIFDLAGQKNSNYQIFQKILQPHAPAPAKLQPGAIEGNPPTFCDNLCLDLGLCAAWGQRGHLESKWHPPLCDRTDTCQDNSAEHRKLRRHKILCPDNTCKIMFGSEDTHGYKEHITVYSHKQICYVNKCQEPNHLHPPLCMQGMSCDHLGKRHPDGYYYAHMSKVCKYKTKCIRWSDQDHMACFCHPSIQLCSDAAWCARKSDDAHLRSLAHLCPWGSHCKEITDENHTRRFLHPHRERCPDGVNCKAHKTLHVEDHLCMFDHVGCKYLRPMCRFGAKCTKKDDQQHVKQFAHPMPQSVLPVCAVYGHNTVRHLLEDKPEAVGSLSFKANAKEMIRRVESFKPFKGSKPQPKVLKEVTDFLKKCRPVHRLSVPNFSKAAQSGFLASHHFLRTLSTDVLYAAQLPSVVEPLCEHPDQARTISDFVDAVLKHSEMKSKFETSSQTDADTLVAKANGSGGKYAEVSRLATEVTRYKGYLSFLRQEEVQRMEKDIADFLAGMQKMRVAADQIAEGGKQPEFGIGFWKDRLFETNKNVFAILGPHTYPYGVEKDSPCQGVHIIFDNTITFHPDVFFTPMAATFYESGHGDGHRPWSPQGSGNSEQKSYDFMSKEKLHPSAPGCFEALAWDFIARAAKKVTAPSDYNEQLPEGCDLYKAYRPLSEVTLTDVLTYWKNANAHYVVECHLPYLTPLTLVEKVVVAKESLSKVENDDCIQKVFGGKIHTTPTMDSVKVQMDLACGPLPRPEILPSFQWTLMAVKHAEVVLPETLPTSERSRILFRASVPHFTIGLAQRRNGTSLLEPFIISVYGDRCSARLPLKEGTSLPRFNENLRANLHSIMYCLEVEPSGFVTLKHVGASQIFNIQSFGLQFSPGLKFVSFSAEGFIQFTDVRVCSDGQNDVIYEHEKDIANSSTLEDSSEPLKAEKATDRDESEGDGWVARALQRGIRFFGLGDGKSAAKPSCPKCLSCQVAYFTRKDQLSESDQQHLKDMRHYCKWGKSCTLRKNPEHEECYMHLEKEICPDGDKCRRLTNVHHRARLHHQGKGMVDFLLPCREGRACTNMHPKHLELYHHDNIDYVMEDGELRLQPTAKPGDRGGAASSSGLGGAAASSGHGRPPLGTPTLPSFGDVPGEVDADDAVMGDIYNDAAIKGHYGEAKLDMYGSPIGDFELAKDGSFRDYKVLIGRFYHGEGLPEDLEDLTIPELKKKGFEVLVRDTVTSFTEALKNNEVHVAWVISSNRPDNSDMQAFVSEVRRFHEGGRGLMVWGDNDPYFVQANHLLKDLFNFELTGNTRGGNKLVPGEPDKPGFFDRGFKVCAGIECLHEGITICYPDKVQPGWQVFGTSSDKKPVLLAKEASSQKRNGPGTGRVIVDNGFTKIYKSQWSSAGTARYVSNCTAWLVLRERFRLPGWEFGK